MFSASADEIFVMGSNQIMRMPIALFFQQRVQYAEGVTEGSSQEVGGRGHRG